MGAVVPPSSLAPRPSPCPYQYARARSCQTHRRAYYSLSRRPTLSTTAQVPLTTTPRATKFRQAAFVYLHVAILYEAAAYAMWRENMLPGSRVGPGWLWLILGAVVAVAIFFALLRWQNVVFARVIWAVHAMRLPSLISYAFVSTVEGGMTRSFYVTAIVVVTINLWMLARAAWDL